MTTTLRQIPISKIRPNPNNPRGLDIVQEDEKLSYLKDSIARFGVMVPVVVTPCDGGFFLIDGERRFHAAQSVGLDRLPAFIIENEDGTRLTSRDLLYRMFQIHHLREQWGPVQQCRALEGIYREIERTPSLLKIADVRAQLRETVVRLAERTGIDDRTAFDRIKFLRWPEDVKSHLYSNPTLPGYSYILEIEDKIIIPAQANYPEYFDVVDPHDVRRDLFAKLEAGLGHAKEVRQVAPYFRAKLPPSTRKAVVRVLERLRKEHSLTYDDARSALEKAVPQVRRRDPPSPRRLVTQIEQLTLQLDEFPVDSLQSARGRAKAAPVDVEEALNELSRAIREIMDRIGGSSINE